MTRRFIKGSVSMIIFVSLIIPGCRSRTAREFTDTNKKPELTSQPGTSGKTAILEKVTFFIENSGSMSGYVNQPNEFKNSLVGLAYLPEFDRVAKRFYFINGTSNPLLDSKIHIKYIGDDPEVFKNSLNPRSFNTGDVRFSDLNSMFGIALDSAGGNQISVLVSDCIYDVGEEKDPLTALRIEIQKTQQAFRDRIARDDIQTFIIKTTSRFDGLYYYASKSGHEKIEGGERPFYTIIFGKSQLLNTMLTDRQISGRISGPYKTARFFVSHQEEIPYQIVPSVDVKGEFKPDYRDKYRLTNARPLKGEFQFTFAADFSSLPFSDSYLTSTDNYDCPNSNFRVEKVIKISGRMPGVEGTHLITVFTDKNPVGELEVVLKNVSPQWVMETDTDNENLIDSDHTYGFKYLTDAVSGAYAYRNNGRNPATFRISITN